MPRSLPLLAALLLLPAACRRADAPASPPASPARATLSGRVRLEGSPPPASRLPTVPSVQRTCGEAVEDPSLKVGAQGGVAEVLVFLEAPPAPPPAGQAAPVLGQQGCLFQPAVLGARAGSTLQVRNGDPLLHNVRAAEQGRSLFNVAMPLEGMTLARALPAGPAVVEVRCDVHPWMRATVRTFAHPHFVATDAEGRFRLEGLPEGRQVVRVWHPRLPEQRFEVELSGARPATLDVAWQAGQVQPPSR